MEDEIDDVVENLYDEVEIDDMDWEEDEGVFRYPCPCGDRFLISIQQIVQGEEIATCPSCSLKIRVIFDHQYIQDFIQEHSLQTMVAAH